MGDQNVLDLFWPDSIARGLDQIILAGQEPDVAILVHADHVAGPAPAVADRGFLLIIVPPVHGPRGSPGEELSGFSRLAVLSLLVDHLELVSRDSGPDSAGLDPLRGRGADED